MGYTAPRNTILATSKNLQPTMRGWSVSVGIMDPCRWRDAYVRYRTEYSYLVLDPLASRFATTYRHTAPCHLSPSTWRNVS
jgi:hypothetical protein